MTSSVNLCGNINLSFKTEVVSASSPGGKKRTFNGVQSIGYGGVPNSGDVLLNPSQLDLDNISSVFRNFPSYYSYSSFINSPEVRDLSPQGKLYLLTLLNHIMYDHMYKTGDIIDVSDYKMFSTLAKVIDGLDHAGNADYPVAVCQGISRFTAKLANDLGFESYIASVHDHDITLIRMNNNKWAVIDGEFSYSNSSDPLRMLTNYQVQAGVLVPIVDIQDPDGKIIINMPTYEGRVLLNVLGYEDPTQSVRRMMNGSGSMPGPVPGANVNIRGQFSSAGQPEFFGVNSRIGIPQVKGLGVDLGIGMLNGNDNYMFGAIDNGWYYTVGLNYAARKGESSYYFAFDYSRFDLDGYMRSDAQLSATNNNIDLYSLTGAWLYNSSFGKFPMRTGNIFSGITLLNHNASNSDNSGGGDLIKDVPFSYITFPGQKGSLYIGTAAPVEILTGPTLQINWNPQYQFRPGFAVMGGGSLDASGGTVNFDAMVEFSPYFTGYNAGLSFNSGGQKLAIDYLYRQTALEAFVPNQREIGLTWAVNKGDNRFSLSAVSGMEQWPSDENSYSRLLIYFSHLFNGTK